MGGVRLVEAGDGAKQEGRRRGAFALRSSQEGAQKGLILPRPFFFFFLLEDSSLRSALGAFFLLLALAAGCVEGVSPGLMSFCWRGAWVAFSTGGRAALEGPTGWTTALGSAALELGALMICAPSGAEPAAGGANCSGAFDGLSLRGGSFAPVGAAAVTGAGGRPAS